METCKTEEQKNKALHVESICKKIVSERRILGASRVTRGVITDIPVDEDLQKLKLFFMEFQASALPEKVKIGCMSFLVRPYIPPLVWTYCSSLQWKAEVSQMWR